MSIFLSGADGDIANRLVFLSQKNRVIANNIANANVPNYTAKRLNFSDVFDDTCMKLKLVRTNKRHLSDQNKLDTINDFSIKDTHKPVELDKEIVEMTKASMKYQALVEILSNRFNLFNKIISGRVE